ncbi:MAG: SMC-Scp complex subunit ScpB [Planctomycetaceae bacterium]
MQPTQREATPGSSLRWSQRLQNRKASTTTYFSSDIGQFARSNRMARVEAVLLISNSPITTRRLAQLATLADAGEAKTIIDKLNYAYDTGNSSFRIERVAAGYRMLTRPELVFWLDRLHKREARCRLSQSMLETLTIVAYQQPVTRADVEAVRGVASTEVLKQLMERGLVRIAGHDDSLGRPYLYGTTRLFLEMYGLKNLDDMPMADELRRKKPTGPTIDEIAASLIEEDQAEEDEDLDDEEDEDWDDEDEEEDDDELLDDAA